MNIRRTYTNIKTRKENAKPSFKIKGASVQISGNMYFKNCQILIKSLLNYQFKKVKYFLNYFLNYFVKLFRLEFNYLVKKYLEFLTNSQKFKVFLLTNTLKSRY